VVAPEVGAQNINPPSGAGVIQGAFKVARLDRGGVTVVVGLGQAQFPAG
jgi:hypothetical protein